MPEAGRHRAYLESPGLDAAGVHEVLDEVLEAKAAAAEGPGQHRELLPRHGERARDVALAVRENDAVGERHERLREGRLVERRVLAPPAGNAAALALALLFGHVGILKRTRVP